MKPSLREFSSCLRDAFVVAILVPFALITSPSQAHEMWLEPASHTIPFNGDPILGETRVGERYEGYGGMFLPRDFDNFDVIDSNGRYPVQGVVGDRPPLNVTPREDGLTVIVYLSTARNIRFRDWKKFASYLAEMGIEPPLERHLARGLDPNDFKESYRRSSKTLVAVGSGAGEDLFTGMPFELVALENPYTHDAGLTALLPVQLLRTGKMVPNWRVTLFHKRGDQRSMQFLKTDENGIVQVPALGQGRYLLNAVDLSERYGTSEAPWHSDWASLTYGSGDADGLPFED